MKIIFQFDTNDENFSYHELEMYKQAESSVRALSEIQDKMRSWIKYDQTPIVDENTFSGMIYQMKISSIIRNIKFLM